MNQIQGGRWDTFLRRYFSLKQGSVAPEVEAIISPVLSVTTGSEPELFALRGEHLYNCGTNQGAVAAQRTWFQLRNPAGSSTIVSLLMFQMWSSAARDFAAYLIPIAATWGAGTQDLTARLDGRIDTPAAAQVFHGTSAVALPTNDFQVESGRFFANDPMPRSPLYFCVIPPGQMLMCADITVNQGSNFNIKWRERGAEPSELGSL